MLRLSFVAAALHRHPGWFNLIPNLSSRAPRTDLFFAPLFCRAVRAERDLSSSLVVSRPSNFARRAVCWPRPGEPSNSLGVTLRLPFVVTDLQSLSENSCRSGAHVVAHT